MLASCGFVVFNFLCPQFLPARYQQRHWKLTRSKCGANERRLNVDKHCSGAGCNNVTKLFAGLLLRYRERGKGRCEGEGDQARVSGIRSGGGKAGERAGAEEEEK